MIDEHNLVEGGVGYIDGSMDLGTESPLEMNENKNVSKMNERQFRNLVYEMALKMLDEQLNEDDPMVAGAAPIGGAPAGAPMDPMAGAAMPVAAPEDADKNVYKDRANKKKLEIAQKVGDNTGGAPGFNPQGTEEGEKDKKGKDKKKDKDKKELAEQIAKSVIKQFAEHFRRKR